jgi:hypothetical protein
MTAQEKTYFCIGCNKLVRRADSGGTDLHYCSACHKEQIIEQAINDSYRDDDNDGGGLQQPKPG